MDVLKLRVFETVPQIDISNFKKHEWLLQMNVLMAEHTHFKSVFQVGCHHIARGLEKKGHSVTYISRCLTPTLFINFREKKKRIINYLKGGEIELNGIYSYVPFTLLPFVKFPLFDNEWVASRYLRLTVPRLSAFCKKKGPFDVFLVGDPYFAPLIPYVDSGQTILRLTDNLTAFDHVPKAVHDLVDSALSLCDKVIVTSRPLMESLSENSDSKPVYYVPNGVDFGHFSKNFTSEPADMRYIKRPRAIYVGALDGWFDVHLLERTASRLRDVSFIIIGPPAIDLRRLSALSNVHILGHRPYDIVPHYMAGSDIGIIPFKRNALTDCISPIKLFEYMASGLPVVATEWNELKSIRSPACLAKNDSHFIRLVSETIKALAGKDEYRAFAKENSWSKRVDDIERIILVKA
jgi:glycosyltransferase involved in cell wall biosynthesis